MGNGRAVRVGRPLPLFRSIGIGRNRNDPGRVGDGGSLDWPMNLRDRQTKRISQTLHPTPEFRPEATHKHLLKSFSLKVATGSRSQ